MRSKTKKIRDMEWAKRPVSWIKKRILYISIPFTWHLSKVRSALLQRSFLWDRVVVGGPAVSLMPDFFVDFPHVSVGVSAPGILQRINPLATRTTAGCPNRCGFCGVSRINGEFVELEDWPDLPVLIDDNLLAASQHHFDKVIDRLIKHQWCDFSQGLDADLLTDYHAKRIAQIKKPMIRLALDNMSQADRWLKAVEVLRRAGIAKKSLRSYALVGYNTDPAEAWQRCQFVEKHVDHVLPMWFHPLDSQKWNAVSLTQHSFGWTDFERQRLFAWYYRRKRLHAGSREALLCQETSASRSQQSKSRTGPKRSRGD